MNNFPVIVLNWYFLKTIIPLSLSLRVIGLESNVHHSLCESITADSPVKLRQRQTLVRNRRAVDELARLVGPVTFVLFNFLSSDLTGLSPH